MKLLSLPYELAILLAQHLNDEDDLLALRLTCREVNILFRELHVNQIFERRYVFCFHASLQDLIKISESKMAPRVRHLSFWSTSPLSYGKPNSHLYSTLNGALRGDEISDMLSTAFFKLPNIRSFTFEAGSSFPLDGKMRAVLNMCPAYEENPIPPGRHFLQRAKRDVGLAHVRTMWAPAMDAVLRAGLSTVKSISCPFVFMEEFEFQPAQMMAFKTVLSRLRKLEVGDLDPDGPQPSNSDSTASRIGFYTWIAHVGAKVETFKIRNPTSWVVPKLPLDRTFNLSTLVMPSLKRVSIENVYLMINEVGAILRYSQGLEELRISACRVTDPIKDWFDLLKYLRQNGFDSLRRLELNLSGNHKCTDLEFELPNIEIYGNWNVDSTSCTVRLPIGKSKKRYYVTHKNLRAHLDAISKAEVLWRSLTDGKWTSKQVTGLG
ncbi:hypothetical protein H072_9410 [Dactylellina haptotyla CBS 200.50]|uniref:F-box domain-containing protein n=1 Tax=Dactylellina haptotyla (strain CBS 200.50) TaxID=1284197 RepID=S8BCV3_DACHA|nr:hypothetical protein H072_9410 [Dactylellina haptotyla CBS 200.50]